MADVSTGLVSGVRRLSAEALDARVRRIASGLVELGVEPGNASPS
jgi:non-ribosomal peptide synthetase component E (peptide arylation enzyme)